MLFATESDQKFAFQLDEFYLDLQEDGRNIRVLSHEEIARMPFPGLRPFKTSEFQLFKGRSGQAEELLRRLKPSRFLAVIGSSGTGKSSLVRAGLIPQLFGCDFHAVGNKWNIAICRPGKNPIANLAIALASVKAQSKDRDQVFSSYEEIEPLLSRSLYGLLDTNELLNEGKSKEDRKGLLVIVDQFEEIFRYDRKELGRENIENHFVDLLLKAAANQANPVYVIITMRSEFLGDCVRYRGLPEAINKGQYLVPGLKRNELKEVIEGPVNLAGKEISPGLVELLINEMEDSKLKENLDQLPILQHALMRTYQQAGNAPEINFDHYHAIGEMHGALARHAKEKFDLLADKNNPDTYSQKQQIAKLIFQSLTDASTDLKGGRRPLSLKHIYAVTSAIGATKEEVNEVINTFRDSETSFIMPPSNVPVHEELIMDISHESLMRNWDILKKWIEEEVRYGRFYQRLHERREEDAQLIQGPLLAELINWRDNYPHSAAWASRYHQLPAGVDATTAHEALYQNNLAFLEKSRQAMLAAQDAEKRRIEEEAEERRQEDLRKQQEAGRKRLIWLLSTGMLVTVFLTLLAYSQRQKALNSYQEVNIQKKQVEKSARLLAAQKQAAEDASRNAQEQRDTAVKLAGELRQRQQELEIANRLAQQEKNRALMFQAKAEQKSIELERHLAQNHLHSKHFYESGRLTAADKEKLVALLLKDTLTSMNIRFEKYIDTPLLEEVNEAVRAVETIADVPELGLRKADSIWKRSKHQAAIQLIIPEIFQKNIFPNTEIDWLANELFLSTPSTFTTLPQYQNFAFANETQIVTGSQEAGEPQLTSFKEVQAALAALDTSYGSGKTALTKINALSFAAPNQLMALVNDDVLVQWQEKGKPQLQKLAGSKSVRAAAIAPNGKTVATISDDGPVRVWHPDTSETGKLSADEIRNLGVNTGFKSPRQLLFAPNSQKLMALYDNGCGVWNMATKTMTRPSNWTRVTAASFSSDSKFLLAAVSSSHISVWDSVQIRNALNLIAPNDPGFTAGRITEVALSPNWRTLLVNHNGTLVLYQGTEGDSIIRANGSKGNERLLGKKLFSFTESVNQASYLDSTTVMALVNNGLTYFWRINPLPVNTDQAFASIRYITDSSFEDKYEAGTVNLNQIFTSTNKKLLYEAAGFYYDKTTLDEQYDNNGQAGDKNKMFATAERLYQQLEGMEKGFAKYLPLYRLTTLYENRLYDEEQKETPDTTRIISQTQQIAREREKLLSLMPENEEIKRTLSNNYWDLSWFHLFTKQFNATITTAKRGLELDSLNDGIYTNLALGYLLTGEFAAAEAIYKKYKDKNFHYDPDRTFQSAFCEDFDVLEEKGIITPNVPAIYKKVAEIKAKVACPKVVPADFSKD